MRRKLSDSARMPDFLFGRRVRWYVRMKSRVFSGQVKAFIAQTENFGQALEIVENLRHWSHIAYIFPSRSRIYRLQGRCR